MKKLRYLICIAILSVLTACNHGTNVVDQGNQSSTEQSEVSSEASDTDGSSQSSEESVPGLFEVVEKSLEPTESDNTMSDVGYESYNPMTGEKGDIDESEWSDEVSESEWTSGVDEQSETENSGESNWTSDTDETENSDEQGDPSDSQHTGQSNFDASDIFNF